MILGALTLFFLARGARRQPPVVIAVYGKDGTLWGLYARRDRLRGR